MEKLELNHGAVWHGTIQMTREELVEYASKGLTEYQWNRLFEYQEIPSDLIKEWYGNPDPIFIWGCQPIGDWLVDHVSIAGMSKKLWRYCLYNNKKAVFSETLKSEVERFFS